MVKNFLKNSAQILFAKQTNILSAAGVIGFMVLLSRLLGLVKYHLLTDRFTVPQIGVWLAAFRLPNTIFDLIVTGALATAFIPVFTSFLSHDKQEDANILASSIINIAAIFFFVLSAIFLVFAEPLVHLIAPGLSPEELALAVPFTRIMLVGQTLPLVLGSFITGILQSHKRFFVPALAPVVYNLGIAIGIIFLTPVMGLYSAVWGVVLGAILFLLVQIPLLTHLNVSYRFKINLSHQGVREVGRLILPRTFGLAITQLNYTANLILTSIISTRAITIFTFAQQLQQLPISLFGVTISQAALPTLSEEKARNDIASFSKTFLNSFMQILFLTLPAAAVLIVLRIPVVRLVYGASKFDWPATVETGRTLAFFGLSLVSESLVNLMVRCFFALKDSKTPVNLGAISTFINVFLAIFFVILLHFPVWSLAASAAAADVAFSLMLLIILNQKIKFITLKGFLVPAFKMMLAAAITLVSLYVPMKLLDQLVFDTSRTIPLLLLTGTAGIIGLSVYLFFTWVLDIEELAAFMGIFKKFKDMLFKADEVVSEIITTEAPATSTGTIEEKN